ncbi:GNAT family N-acetyltransferase [Rhodoferax sp.]|uniref:GNAT family N-acetyltransferase n=1 Tax=Rhodoferax sp. TaxID=50421 RepID=UPI0019ED3C78|nr:GNAT family N-acetyltransferase [Rhodoferax sp.]MBE0474835.1 GNAT family N-acetyltransferase [Rhodoferax sp.]
MNPAASHAAALGAASHTSVQARASRKPDVMVPIRSLGENHRARIAGHLKALDAHDRYYRFGFSANDEQIERYVDGLNFDRDEIFGIYNRHLVLIAMAHLAYAPATGADQSAEFGVSVLPQARGRHYGSRLFERAVMHARNVGVRKLYVHVLSENTAMLRIASHAGATFVRDGAETEGHLVLPPATMNTHLTEMVEEQLAQANYQFKLQARQFHNTLASLQNAWRGGDGVEKHD